MDVLARAKRPIDVKALDESFDGEPLWRRVPPWSVVSTQDASLPLAAQREMAARARAEIVEVTASHASPLSQPDAVAAL